MRRAARCAPRVLRLTLTLTITAAGSNVSGSRVEYIDGAARRGMRAHSARFVLPSLARSRLFASVMAGMHHTEPLLELHFDVNKTIIMTDAIQGLGSGDVAAQILCSTAYGKLEYSGSVEHEPVKERWVWDLSLIHI